LVPMTDWALTRLCQSAPFTKSETAFYTPSRLNNEVIPTFVHRFPDMSKMIMDILFRNSQKTREFLC